MVDEAGCVVVELVLSGVAPGLPGVVSFGFAIPHLRLGHLDCHIRHDHSFAVVISLGQVHLPNRTPEQIHSPVSEFTPNLNP
jgi:hypothetical protein